MVIMRTGMVLLILLPATVGAQINFGGALSGANEVPPVVTGASGTAVLVLGQPSNVGVYKVRTTGLAGTAAHIHRAPAGSNGPVVYPLSGGPAEWTGTIGPLTATEIGDLMNGLWYVNVHTALNPGGEIRGQLSVEYKDPYSGSLTGAQEVPPVITPATGAAALWLNVPENTIGYEVTTSLLAGGTAAHIHRGAPGTNGPVVIGLSGGPTRWCGVTRALTSAELADLQAGNLYVNVHTAANPGGEIRGQLGRGSFNAAARLSGSEEVPPVPSAATGFGVFSLDAAMGTLTYDVRTNVVGGTAAHLHRAPIGQNGGIAVPLAGGPANWAGNAAVSAATASDLKNRLLYANVHTGTYPGGEIRGQAGQNPSAYGFGTPGTGGVIPRIGWAGLPSLGNAAFAVNLKGGRAGGAGFLFLSFGAASVPLAGAGLGDSWLWVDLSLPIFFPAGMDAQGCAAVVLGIPNVASLAGFPIFFQWALDAPGVTPAGYVTSDGLLVLPQP